MKKLLFCLICLTHLVHSQTVPQGINYQAVIRNNAGAIATNSIISLKFDLYNSSALSPIAYSETQTNINTGPMGVATCTIGSINPTSFAANVNWAGGDVWYQVSLNLGSGFNTIGGPQKFMTVPYAFYAAKAPTTFSLSGNTLYSVGGSTVTIPSGGSLTSTITGQGLATVTPTSGTNFTINVPQPFLSVSNGTLLSIVQGSFSSASVPLPNPLWTLFGTALYPSNPVNVGIGTNTPVHKLMVSENVTNNSNAAIYGINSGLNNSKSAVIGINSPSTGSGSNNAHGIEGATNSTHTLSAAVYGNNIGNGSSIYGNKTGGSTGSAGRFIKTVVNSEPSLHAETDGTGAAVYAKSNNNNNPLALEVNGHIKSSQSTIPTININNTKTSSSLISVFSSSCTNCSDVKGNVTLFDLTSNTVNVSTGDFITVRVNFSKPYTSPNFPIVTISQNSLAPFFYSYISEITNSYFEVTYFSINPTNFGISTNKFFKFNYMVIE